MPIFQFVSHKLTMRNFARLEQPQVEGLLDVLTAAKAIDGEIHPDEKAELEQAIKVLPWNGATTPERYIDESIQRAMNVEVTPEALLSFFQDISARLGEDWLRQEAYYYAARISLADQVVQEEERLLLANLVEAFEIQADKQELIIRKVSREMDF